MDWRKLFLEAHTIRRDGAILLRRKLRRADVICIVADLPACLVGIDACVWCIYWLVGWMTLGHKVRLELLAYVKRRKTDAADAEAICEAVTLPSMRVAAGKNVKQRRIAAWFGLTLRENGSRGKERLSGIAKQGVGYFRRQLVVGATAVMRLAQKNAARQPLLVRLLERKPAKIVR